MRTRTACRILVLSNARLHREALVACLAADPKLEIVGAEDGWSCLSADEVQDVDVVVVDTPSLADSAFLPRLSRLGAQVRIVAVSVSDDELGSRWLQAGLIGLVPADASTEELVEAVRKAGQGEFVCSPRVAAMLLSRLAALSRYPHVPDITARLTLREGEILGLLERGLSNKEIARRLAIEATTVKNHVHNILGKLNAKRRSEIPQLLRGLHPARFGPANTPPTPPESPRRAFEFTLPAM